MNTSYECHMKESVKLYKIGMFAHINRITIKALRYYDQVDLLKPERVDEENGYRYYTSSQLPRLHKILALKEMGFSIEEMKQVLKGVAEDVLLKRKKQECIREVSMLTNKIAMIDCYLCGSILPSSLPVVLKPLPEVNIAYKHLQLPNYGALFEEMPSMGVQMEEAGCECAQPEYCFNIYYDDEYKAEDVEVDICEAVVQLLPDHGDLKFKHLAKVDLAACVLHVGSYATLPSTYAYIVKFIEENGYEMIGAGRESYIDGVWNKDCEEEWLTEIQFPVEKRK